MKYIVRIIRMNTKPPTQPPMIAPIGRSVPIAIRKNKYVFYDVRIPKNTSEGVHHRIRIP
jgi:hypothetical protein